MAKKVVLFGREFELAADTTPITPSGAFGATGTIALQPGNILAINLAGDVCGTTLSLVATFTYQIAGTRLTLVALASVATLAITVQLDRPKRLSNLAVQVAADKAIGISFIARDSDAFVWLNQGQRLPPAVTVRTPFSWSEILLDSSRERAIHRSVRSDYAVLTWKDHLTGTTLIGPTQELLLGDLVFTPQGYEVAAAPKSGALFLHADVLDTAPEKQADNEMLFQYAVANGELVARGRTSTASSQLAWRGKSGGDPALLLLRHQDEHGAPLVLIPDKELPLVERGGVTAALKPPSGLAKLWNQTNRAMVIGTKEADGAIEIGGTLASLDIAKLYAVMADPQKVRNGFTAPWFVKDGEVPIAGSPREIHNVAMNSWLKATTGKATAPQVSLIVTPHADADALTVFHTTSLTLGDSRDWTLMSMRAERDLKPDAGHKSSANEIGTYQSKAIARPDAPVPTPVELPAIDYAYAVSNLAGGRRAEVAGGGTGALTRLVKEQIAAFDMQFAGETPTVFGLPDIPVQRHIDGAGVKAMPKGYARLLDQLPVRADVAGTALTDPVMDGAKMAQAQPWLAALHGFTVPTVSPPTAQFVFGGTPSPVETAIHTLGIAAEQAAGKLDAIVRQFEPRWRRLAGEAADPYLKLRQRLAIPSALATLDEDQAGEMIDAAITLLRTNDNLADISADSEALAVYFGDLDPIEFQDRWAETMADSAPPSTSPADGEVRLALLFHHLCAPPDADLMRRVIRYLADMKSGSVTIPGVDPLRLADMLFGTTNIAALVSALDEIAGGIVQGVVEGLGEAWRMVAAMWDTPVQSDVLDELRARYGPIFTPDVYRRLLEPLAGMDAQLLLEEIRRNLPIDITSLADLSFEPPDYLFRTTRFPIIAPQEAMTKALWRQAFDMCAFMTEKAWSFFLDDGSSMIVKLSRRRGLDDILREIVRDYATSERIDPLGVTGQLPGAVASRGGSATDLIDRFIRTLDGDLLAKDWVGVFFVRPIADLHLDRMLCDLVGFDHIAASYVAVGGRMPDVSGAFKKPAIDVWAHIFKEETNGKEMEADPRKEGHVQLAVTKFDVRIRQTKLSDAAIEIRIYPKDVWGRSRKDQANPDPGFPTVILHGGLEPPGKDPQAPRDLVFAAVFPDKLPIDVDLAFLKTLSLERLRVARRGGATSIDIDGSILLQDAPDLGLDLDLDGSSLNLTNFRIQLPTLRGIKVPVGALRKLDFDFPAVSFALPNARAVTLFGVEVTPVGIGYLRGNEREALDALKRQFIWFRSFKEPPANSYIAHVTSEFDFGKNPKFGLIDARGLRFRTIFAVTVKDGYKPDSVAVGIGGLDARDLKISLFGVVKVQMERLRILPAKLHQENGNTYHAGAILAENLQLKILNWSPLPKGSRFDLMMFHPNDAGNRSDRRKGLLAFYDAEAEPTEGDKPEGGDEVPQADDDAFFKIYWLLLAHNMKLPPKALTYLLQRGPSAEATDEYKGLFKNLLDKPDPPAQSSSTMDPLELRGVDLLSEESWLFGMSFRLKGLFDRCNLVLHDQHYYGIHLWAEWVEVVFGMKSLELAYIPGKTREDDRFRCNLPLPKLSFLGDLSLGEIALEWSFRWDFLIDIGFPWHGPEGYDWFRAFSIPAGAYEGKFGFYVEKRTTALQKQQEIELGAGVALYVGYFFGAGNSVAWVRAGIGIFGILEGRIAFAMPKSTDPLALLRSTIRRIEVTGVVGIFAYGEGGVDVWILSARFRVSAQASCQTKIIYVVNGPCTLSYRAELAAGYRASVKVGSGFCSWTFRVSGSVQMPVTGKLLLS